MAATGASLVAADWRRSRERSDILPGWPPGFSILARPEGCRAASSLPTRIGTLGAAPTLVRETRLLEWVRHCRHPAHWSSSGSRSDLARSALADVSFNVYPQQILGLIGPNGAGKTTLLECLSGLLPTDSGQVFWQGNILPPQRRKTVMFYLPDGIVPYPHQTVRQVLDFFRDVYAADRSHARQLARALGLLPLLDRRIEQLSKGERRRLLLGISLLVPHPLLTIDEPFDGLDLRQTLEMMELLRAARARGAHWSSRSIN